LITDRTAVVAFVQLYCDKTEVQMPPQSTHNIADSLHSILLRVF